MKRDVKTEMNFISELRQKCIYCKSFIKQIIIILVSLAHKTSTFQQQNRKNNFFVFLWLFIVVRTKKNSYRITDTIIIDSRYIYVIYKC